MTRSRTILAPLAGIALVLAACGASPGDAPSAAASPTDAPPATASEAASASAEASEQGAAEETVRLEGFAFDTEQLTIAAGTSVRFVNADGAAHTVTEGSDGTAADDPILDEELAPNGATSFVFDEPGTYQITCLIHPSMNMTVIVE